MKTPKALRYVLACSAVMLWTGDLTAQVLNGVRGPTGPVIPELLRYDLQTLDLPATEQERFTAEVRLGDQMQTLVLDPYTLRADDFQVLVQGEDGQLRQVEPPPPRTYHGTVQGEPLSRVAATLIDRQLSAVVALTARDRGGPRIAHQLLIYPVTDCAFDTASYEENAEGYLLTMDAMKWYWNHYLSSDADASNPYAAPLAAKDLSGLPPALVITAEFDPLRDEGEAYAKKLQDAGVATTATRYDGMIHGFFGMSAVLDKGAQAVAQASSALKAAFAAQKATAAR